MYWPYRLKEGFLWRFWSHFSTCPSWVAQILSVDNFLTLIIIANSLNGICRMKSEYGQNLSVFWFFSWYNHLMTVSANAVHWKSTDRESLRELNCSLPVRELLDLSSSNQSSAVGISCALGDLWLYQRCCFQYTQSRVCLLGRQVLLSFPQLFFSGIHER